MHGGQASGKRNHEGEKLLEFAVANELVVGNSWFKKKFGHLVTYQSEDCKTQIDYILYKRSFRKMASNMKVIVGEESATQHRLVVGDFKVCTHAHPKKRFVFRIKVWKLEDFGNQVEFSNFFNALIKGNETGKTLDERWKYLKNNLINATKQVCGVSARHTWKRQTWWWNDKVQQAVSHKRKCFKVWKAGGDRHAYQTVKRASNLTVRIAKTDAEKIAFKKINLRSVEIYRLAKQMRRENQDVIGDKPMRNNNGQMFLNVDSKKEAWIEHYMHLLKVEFSWNPGGLSEVYPVEGILSLQQWLEKPLIR